ncbi:MAG: hypothetical protein GKR94_10655 [Gammaproteobacteria bacterium]|nr:hypothetical protein [Gammaproteobacteria bacterium]
MKALRKAVLISTGGWNNPESWDAAGKEKNAKDEQRAQSISSGPNGNRARTPVWCPRFYAEHSDS